MYDGPFEIEKIRDSTIGSGGGTGIFANINMEKDEFVFDDFLLGGTFTHPSNVSVQGAGANITPLMSTVNATTGTATTGRANWFLRTLGYLPPTGEQAMNMTAKSVIIPVASDATQRFSTYFMLGNSNGSPADNSTFGFSIVDNVNSGNWVCWSRNQTGDAETVNTTVSNAEARTLSVILDLHSGQSRLRFWIDEVLVGTIVNTGAANPIATVPTNVTPVFGVLKSAGTTARTALMDAIRYHYKDRLA